MIHRLQRFIHWPVLLLLLLLLTGCATTPPVVLERYEFEEPQMGVPFRIVLFAKDEAEATRAAAAAFARIAALNRIMSDYEYDSELSRLSRSSGSGEWIRLSPELLEVLTTAQKFSELSGGAFDVTVGPAVNLWRKARREKALPRPDLLAAMLQRVGHKNLVLSNGLATLRVAEMRLDLGAIAKGHAADEAMKVLRGLGVRRAFVAASGDMVFGEAPPGERGWKVELLETNRVLRLAHCALATSGDLFQRLEIEGRRYSHILNPHTGIGLTNRSLVTVVARTGIIADALSTTLSVTGWERGRPIAKRFKAEARILADEPEGRREQVTPGFWNLQ